MAGDRLQNATYSRLFDRKRVISVTPDIQFPRRMKKHLPVSDVLKTTSKLLNELSNARKPLHVSIGKFPSRVSVLVPRSLGNLVLNLRHLKTSNTFQGH